MPYETITLDREETYAVITLNRPPANAISETLMRELNAALSDVEADGAVRSVILTGAGDRIFCAGADLGNAFSGPDVATFIRFGNSVVRRIGRFPQAGGGCDQWPCPRRGLRDRDGLSHPPSQGRRPDGP